MPVYSVAMDAVMKAGYEVSHLPKTRETALVMTKIDEARMWLENYELRVKEGIPSPV